MGTNYYVKQAECPCCRITPPLLHIGKENVGWTFTFEVHRAHGLHSIGMWMKYIADPRRTIETEYGMAVEKEAFWELVKQQQLVPHRKHHANEHPSRAYRDSEGFNFIDGHFT